MKKSNVVFTLLFSLVFFALTSYTGVCAPPEVKNVVIVRTDYYHFVVRGGYTVKDGSLVPTVTLTFINDYHPLEIDFEAPINPEPTPIIWTVVGPNEPYQTVRYVSADGRAISFQVTVRYFETHIGEVLIREQGPNS